MAQVGLKTTMQQNMTFKSLSSRPHPLGLEMDVPPIMMYAGLGAELRALCRLYKYSTTELQSYVWKEVLIL